MRADAFAPYANGSAVDAAFNAGTFGNAWISENAADLELLLAKKKAVYDKALDNKRQAEAHLTAAEPGLAQKKAAYDKAVAQLNEAEAQLADAQAWYDRAHPVLSQTVQAEFAVEAKVAAAKHAKAPESAEQLAQTGDTIGEVFWVGGIAFVAAGVTIGAAMKRRQANG